MPEQDFTNQFLSLLRDAGGYYQCPKDGQGRRLGPLVGYSKAALDGQGRRFVGDHFVNCATLEQHQPMQLFGLLEQFCRNGSVSHLLRMAPQNGCIWLGVPRGGNALALMLAIITGWRYMFAEKVTVSGPTDQPTSRLTFDRHRPEPGARVIIVDDVFNNFTAAQQALDLLAEVEARPIGLVGLLDRSANPGSVWQAADGNGFPVYTLAKVEMPRFHQDDPFVAADVAAGQVVWEPRDPTEWARLREVSH